ncbi:hypothetical protein [Streptomyces californicus]|uniref:hypothetical protein n=1 Tax=Streptomyces californicus TaxID=67351 RepID=UPI003722C569
MSVSANRPSRPDSRRALPLLRLAALALAAPALFSSTPPLLAFAFAVIAGLGLWMLAFALGVGTAHRARTSRPPLAVAASFTDGLALLTAAGFVLGVLSTGSTLAAVTTVPGTLALASFITLCAIHHRLHRAARPARRRARR